MGTVNYKTSEYITIGLNINNQSYEDHEYNFYNYTELMYDLVQNELNEYMFYYVKPVIEIGYYEGFTIDINIDEILLDYDAGNKRNILIFNDYYEKQEALKEVTLLKRILIKCIDKYNCVECFPHWCTGYNDVEGSKQDVKKAMQELKQDIKKGYTDVTYWRNFDENIIKDIC